MFNDTDSVVLIEPTGYFSWLSLYSTFDSSIDEYKVNQQTVGGRDKSPCTLLKFRLKYMF